MNITPLKPKSPSANPIPPVSTETGLIVHKIASNPANTQTISYAELSALIGRDIRANRGFLNSARHILFRDHGILVETVRNVGVRIASNSGVMNAGIRDVSASRRALKRAARKFDAVEIAALTEEERKTYTGHVAMVNALQLLSKPSSVRKVAEKSEGSPLPSASVLDMFRS
jgi:hypothetical protein